MKNFAKVEFKKQIFNKKMVLSIFYGLIFLISTVALYLINTSSAQDIVDIEFCVVDSDLELKDATYIEKASMEEETALFVLPDTQNNFVVSEYIKISENELESIAEYLVTAPELQEKYDMHQLEKIETNTNTYEVEITENEEITSETEENPEEIEDVSILEELEDKEEIENIETIEEIDASEELTEDQETTITDENILEEVLDEEEIVEQVEEIQDSLEEELLVDEVNVEENEELEESEVITEDEGVIEDITTSEEATEVEDNIGELENPPELEIIEHNKNTTEMENTSASEETEDSEIVEPLSKEEFIQQLTEGKKIYMPGDELPVHLDSLNSNKIYLLAKYNKKEVNHQTLYEKRISVETDKNVITISGYMPPEAEIKVEELPTSRVEEKIRNHQNSDNEVKLEVAYDIKIIVNGVEYEPEEIGENVTVEIEGISGENIKVWHIGNDETIENIETETDNHILTFETDSFSIYGIEILKELSKKEEKSDVVENNEEETIIENLEVEPNAAKGGPLRAPAPNLPHSTLVIDDYTSDYYYYMGQNYTSTIAGTNTNTYSSNNLIRVTLNYYGYAQADAANMEKIGRISLTETQDHIQHIRCVPVSNGSVTIELMENPFMDKPTGYGFGGWTPATGNGTVTQDSKTLTYSVTATASNNMTINLYANWTTARVVYLNPATGCDNLINQGYDGSTPEKPLGSWQAACSRLYTLAGNTTNRRDRENNIIVLTGNIDSSINYSRTITGTFNHTLISADITYNNNVGFTTGTPLIISNSATAIGSNALNGNGNTITNETITNSVPADGTKWTIGGTNNAYSIRNEEGYYLTASNSNNSTISLSTSSFSSWRYDTTNNRFYYRRSRNNGNYYYFYLYYNNGNWTFDTRQSNTGAYGTRLYFHTYTTSNEVYEDIFSNSAANSLANNGSYSSSTNLALTITSLYNHEDYRPNAVMDLTTANYQNTTVYKDIQFDYVNIRANHYRSDTSGTTAATPYFYGRNYNCRIGRGMYPLTNTATDASTFGTVYGGMTNGNDVGTTNSDNNAYKLVIESGKYTQIEGFHGTGSNSYYGTIYVTWGNDIDRAKNDNTQLTNYNRCSVNRGSGKIGRGNVRNPAFIINVKSGTFGYDYIADYSTNNATAYAGIYVGGHGTTTDSSNRDISDRYCIVEGGNIANIIGGLKVTSGSGVQTRIYVKGGTVKNIVGGAGVTETYGDRIIQVTGGTIQYSVSRRL